MGHTAYNSGINEFELFDISKDPYEIQNLITEYTPEALERRSEFDSCYFEVMNDINAGYQSLVIGADEENISLITRNDAFGTPAMWEQENDYGYWNIKVANQGFYSIKIGFLQAVNKDGMLVFRMAPYERSMRFEIPGTDNFLYHNFYLKEGEYSLESWFRYDTGEFIFSLYFEMPTQGGIM